MRGTERTTRWGAAIAGLALVSAGWVAPSPAGAAESEAASAAGSVTTYHAIDLSELTAGISSAAIRGFRGSGITCDTPGYSAALVGNAYLSIVVADNDRPAFTCSVDVTVRYCGRYNVFAYDCFRTRTARLQSGPVAMPAESAAVARA